MKKPEPPKATVTKYRRSFLIGICEGPAIVLRIWKDKHLIYDVDDVNLDDLGKITLFMGDGVTSPYDLVTSENPEDVFSDYKNLCCAFFEQYELGQGGLIPNFVFEVERPAIFEDLERQIQGNAVPDGYVAIETLEDLQNMKNDLSGKYALANHIDASATEDWNGGAGFEPVGEYGDDFEGRFKGNGWVIYNLHINRPTTDFVGLFGYVNINPGIGAEEGIEDAVLLYPNIIGKDYVGGIAGYLNVAGIYGSTEVYPIWRCLVLGGSIRGYHYYIGGLIGFAGTGIKYSVSTANVEGIDYVGGLIGRLYSYYPAAAAIIHQCIAGGNVVGGDGISASQGVGGFVGQATTGAIYNSYAFGNVTGLHAKIGGMGVIKGGIALRCYSFGKMEGLLSSVVSGFACLYPGGSGSATDCFWDTETSEQATSDLGTGKTTIQMKQEATFTNYDFDTIWSIVEGLDYPKLRDVNSWLWLSQFQMWPQMSGFQIRDILTKGRYGAYISENYLDTSTFEDIDNYCIDKGYFFSFVFNERKPVLDWIDYICSHFKGFLVMEGDKIKLKAFQNEASEFILTRDNLFIEEGENPPPPVQVKVRDYKDTANRVEISYTDRDQNYDVAVAVAADEVDQQISGKVRTKTIMLDGIMDVDLAQELAYRQLFECLYRFHFYSFTLSYKNMAIAPGSVGSLNDGFQIIDQRIRILSIDETKDGKYLAIEAVEDKPYLYKPVDYEGAVSRHVQDTPPSLVSALVEFAEDPLEAILGLMIIPQSDDSVEAPGWIIYRAWEEEGDYELLGSYITANVKGTLTSELPAHTSIIYRGEETFTVDVGDYGVLSSASDSAFFSNRSLCKVGSEIIAYKTAERIGETNVFRLTGLIRGIANTEPVAHSVDETFVTLDNPYQFNYSLTDIGRTAYFKVLTFLGDDVQQLEDVSAFSHTITGEYRRPANASLVRISGQEGETDYTGDPTIDWYLANKQSGFNIGGFNNALGVSWKYGDDEDDLAANEGILYGAYILDTNLQSVVLRAEEADETLITEKVLAASAEQKALSFVDDLNSKNPAVIKIIPTTILQSTVKSSITINRIGA